MVAYTLPQQRKKEESKRLRGERDQIKFIDLGRWQVVRFRKARGREGQRKTRNEAFTCFYLFFNRLIKR